MTDDKKKTDGPAVLDFHYTKSQFFRVMHSDGVIGNITPKGDIFISFYNERESFPDKVSYEIIDGRLGKELGTKTTSAGVMRELESAVVLDYDVAKTFLLWLSTLLGQLERFRQQESEKAEENE